MRVLHALTPEQEARAAPLRELYKLLHWGNGSRVVVDVPDRDIPDLAQMGALESVRVLVNGESAEVPFPAGSHLGVEYDLDAVRRGLPVERVFDADRIQRLHLVTPPDTRGPLDRQFHMHRRHAAPLSELARRVGGRQARFRYPNLLAVALVEVTDVIYGTDKKGDGPSNYIHAFSEETHGPRPWLAVDLLGRSWLVGGSYTVPPEGITD